MYKPTAPQKSILQEWRTSIHSLTAMYSCALRGGTADCRLKQPAVFASLRSVQGAGLACQLGRRFKAFHALRSPPVTRAPLRGLRRLPRPPPKGGHPPCVCPPSEGLTTEHRHPDRSPGTPRRTVIFLPIFQPKVGNTFYMARRRQEQTHTQRRDRDIDWRGTSHFLPWMVK